jgi:hypothetical protein
VSLQKLSLLRRIQTSVATRIAESES